MINPENILAIFLFLSVVINVYFYWRFTHLETVVKQDIKERELSNLTPNEVAKAPEENVAFEEDNPWTIPPDVKIEVEGGDTLIPPGYSE